MTYLTQKDHKAISWWAEQRGLTPQLSTPPIMYFRDKDGVESTVNLFSLTQMYKGWLAKERKNNRKKKVAS